MSGQAVLFALASNICFAGLIASLYRPIWFRANGRVPSRWKIGGIWLALCSLCVLLSLTAGFRSPSEAEQVPHIEATQVEALSFDIAIPVEAIDDRAMDAARAADEPMDTAQAAGAEPVPPPIKPLKPMRASGPATRAPTQR